MSLKRFNKGAHKNIDTELPDVQAMMRKGRLQFISFIIIKVISFKAQWEGNPSMQEICNRKYPSRTYIKGNTQLAGIKKMNIIP